MPDTKKKVLCASRTNDEINAIYKNGTFHKSLSYIVNSLFEMELIFLKKPTVEEVINQGIYGPLETKPEERRKYLGTLRERIIVALTKKQVAEAKVYPQIEKYMKEYPKARLFLNGTLNYTELSKYIKIVTKLKTEHTIVTNKDHDTDIGLVLAMDYAIDKEEIYLSKKAFVPQPAKKHSSILQKIFKRRKQLG